MIPIEQAPVWYEYLEMDSDFNMVLRPDTPDDVRRAYEEEQQRILDSEEPIEK